VSLRVAIVTESFLPQINGVTNSVVRVLETLKAREHEALVIAPTAPTSRHLGFPVHQSPNLPLLQFAVGVPSPSISRELDEFKPDVVHVAAPFLLGAQALGWAKRNGVPSVAIYQTDVAGYLERYNLSFAKPVMERLTASIHSLATLNLAPTKLSASYLSALGIPRVGVWGRGVDLDLFNPQNKDLAEAKALRARLGDKPTVGFVGRLAQEKQVHRMAELFGLDCNFLIVGDGPERARLESELGHRAIFVGAKTGLGLSAHYAAMDIFVHFGTEETFGQTIQEAMASGIAVVAPNRGGTATLVKDNQTGFLVDPFLPGAYEAAAVKLFDPQLREGFGLSARSEVQGRSWEANNAKLLGYYDLARALASTPEVEQIELA
jgi:phosphatidylinositol alpha 1,6-mannosyltransferase